MQDTYLIELGDSGRQIIQSPIFLPPFYGLHWTGQLAAWLAAGSPLLWMFHFGLQGDAAMALFLHQRAVLPGHAQKIDLHAPTLH